MPIDTGFSRSPTGDVLRTDGSATVRLIDLMNSDNLITDCTAMKHQWTGLEASTTNYDLSVSVVSHEQITLIEPLLDELAAYCYGLSMECLLTLNLPEELPFDSDKFPFPLRVIRNLRPLGFGANHNQAFRQSKGQFFCILNPDIRLSNNPFPQLLKCFCDPAVGMVAPQVFDPQGRQEDNARCFPSPLTILCKALGWGRRADCDIGDGVIHSEWVAGMFMVLPRERFATLNGFDERYFLYYEDVDLCARLRLQGGDILLCPQAKVVHDARRSSHSSVRYLRWHMRNMLRFFFSSPYWRWVFLKRRRARHSR